MSAGARWRSHVHTAELRVPSRESARKGHYVSVCASYVDGQEQWLLRDDEEANVVEHPAETALWQEDENMKVYMLVYERVQTLGGQPM
eukprot:6248748-Pyramimonas_sp.AAC.1